MKEKTKTAKTDREQPEKHDKLLKTTEVAALLRCTTRSVHAWSKQGLLRPIRLPGRKLPIGFLESEVLKLLNPRP